MAQYLQCRLLFQRLTLEFIWTGDETVAGGRLCITNILS